MGRRQRRLTVERCARESHILHRGGHILRSAIAAASASAIIVTTDAITISIVTNATAVVLHDDAKASHLEEPNTCLSDGVPI